MVSEWNEKITSNLLKGAKEALLENNVSEQNIYVQWVPGSFELPLGAQLMFDSLKLDAVICLGSVIRGETAHFDFVCQTCAMGIKDVGLRLNKPCVFGVLTDDNEEQSIARSGGKLGNKGTEAGVTALKMAALRKSLYENQTKGKVGF